MQQAMQSLGSYARGDFKEDSNVDIIILPDIQNVKLCT